VHAYLAFIVFNAAVVFETGWMRWATLAACGGVAVVWIVRRWTLVREDGERR
jgi:hypothetical protein